MVWPQQEQQKGDKGGDKTPTLVAVIAVAAAIVSLAIATLQANLPLYVRTLSLGAAFLLAAVLLVGIGYSPLKRSLSERRLMSNADEVATKNLPAFLELIVKFRTLTAPGHQDSLASSVMNIKNAPPLNKIPTRQNIYFYDVMLTIIEKLTEQPMSFELFSQLVNLFNTLIGEFSLETQTALNGIRNIEGYRALIPSANIESYNLTRSYYINFLTSLREFGDRLDKQLGVKKGPGVNYNPPFRINVGYYTRPGEL